MSSRAGTRPRDDSDTTRDRDGSKHQGRVTVDRERQPQASKEQDDAQDHQRDPEALPGHSHTLAPELGLFVVPDPVVDVLVRATQRITERGESCGRLGRSECRTNDGCSGVEGWPDGGREALCWEPEAS